MSSGGGAAPRAPEPEQWEEPGAFGGVWLVDDEVAFGVTCPARQRCEVRIEPAPEGRGSLVYPDDCADRDRCRLSLPKSTTFTLKLTRLAAAAPAFDPDRDPTKQGGLAPVTEKLLDERTYEWARVPRFNEKAGGKGPATVLRPDASDVEVATETQQSESRVVISYARLETLGLDPKALALLVVKDGVVVHAARAEADGPEAKLARVVVPEPFASSVRRASAAFGLRGLPLKAGERADLYFAVLGKVVGFGTFEATDHPMGVTFAMGPTRSRGSLAPASGELPGAVRAKLDEWYGADRKATELEVERARRLACFVLGTKRGDELSLRLHNAEGQQVSALSASHNADVAARRAARRGDTEGAQRATRAANAASAESGTYDTNGLRETLLREAAKAPPTCKELCGVRAVGL